MRETRGMRSRLAVVKRGKRKEIYVCVREGEEMNEYYTALKTLLLKKH